MKKRGMKLVEALRQGSQRHPAVALNFVRQDEEYSEEPGADVSSAAAQHFLFSRV
jgi:hypothetical protein